MAMLDVTAHPPGQGRGPLALTSALLYLSGKKKHLLYSYCMSPVGKKKNGSNTQLKNAYPICHPFAQNLPKDERVMLSLKKELQHREELATSGGPLVRDGEEVPRHGLPEPLFVLDRRNHGGGLMLGRPQDPRGLHPCLQLLVPGILPQEVDDANHKLFFLLVDTDQKGVIHDIQRLQDGSC